MEPIIGFLASFTGRLVRAGAGVVLILIGLFGVTGTAGWIVAAIGVVPLAAGALDVCLFAPLVGLPLSGNEIRRVTHAH
jgi:hypothetical protein